MSTENKFMAEMTSAAPQDSGTNVLTGRANRKTKIGKVVSHKMHKSMVVSVERQVKHALYGKYIKKTSTFMVHDENNEAKEGDLVLMMETRPLSKRKRWRLVEILERAK
jgi:small subunit ribosomal protein S17